MFGGPTSAVEREPMQKVSALLLLAMFAVAARYADGARFSEGAGGGEEPWDAGHACAVSARTILSECCICARAFVRGHTAGRGAEACAGR